MLDFTQQISPPRLFFANYTSSLLAVNTTLLLIALAATAGLAVLAYIFYTLTQVRGHCGVACNKKFQSDSFPALPCFKIKTDLQRFGKLW